MQTHLVLKHTLTIGKRRIPVADLCDASSAYQIARDQSGKGHREFPVGYVRIDGKCYRVSYNGKVWDGDTCIMGPQ